MDSFPAAAPSEPGYYAGSVKTGLVLTQRGAVADPPRAAGHTGATTGPRTTRSQRTTPVSTGLASSQVSGWLRRESQVDSTPCRSLARRKPEVQPLTSSTSPAHRSAGRVHEAGDRSSTLQAANGQRLRTKLPTVVR
jgi:hypothetical protein